MDLVRIRLSQELWKARSTGEGDDSQPLDVQHMLHFDSIFEQNNFGLNDDQVCTCPLKTAGYFDRDAFISLVGEAFCTRTEVVLMRSSSSSHADRNRSRRAYWTAPSVSRLRSEFKRTRTSWG